MLENITLKSHNQGYKRACPKPKPTQFGHNYSHCEITPSKDEISLKRKVAATTALGVIAAVAGIAKKQNFKLNPKTIFSQSPKDWAIFKIKNPKKPNGKTLELEEKEIMLIGASSVLGGLVGGVAFDDKKHTVAKLKESLNQYFGNIIVPLAFVAVPSRFYKNNKETIQKYVPQFKNPNKSKGLKFANTFMRAIPPIGLTGVFLGAGIIAGNRVSNFINEKLYHRKVEREIRPTDFAPHLDDVGLAVTLMAPETVAGSVISKFIPLALMVAGNKVGTSKES